MKRASKLEKLERMAEKGLTTQAALDEFKRHATMDDAEATIDLAASLGVDPEGITDLETDGEGGTFKAQGNEYRFFWDEDGAEVAAITQVTEDLTNDPELFEPNWLASQIDASKARDFFYDIYSEWNDSYAGDIKSEPSSEGYENRLVDEMVQRGIVTDEEAHAEGFDPDDKVDLFISEMTSEQIEEGNGGYDHYASNFGEEEAKKLVMEHGLIDIDAAAADAVSTDGWAHFLSHYDGGYETTDKNIVYFREN